MMADRNAPLELLSSEERGRVEEAFGRLLPLAPGLDSRLGGVLGQTLGHPGSLARAQLVYGLLTSLGDDPEVALRPAVAVEAFHTASLLFDDLPAMDDATERRGLPCAHVRFGEGAAILGGLALVTRGYELLWQDLGRRAPERSDAAAALVGECLGVAGILDGQARDLHFDPELAGEGEVLAVARGKTVSLVRLSLVLPALLAAGSREVVAPLERLSESWGLAYQALDDAKDHLLGPQEAGKSTARDGALGRPNLPSVVGWDRTADLLAGWLAAGETELGRLGGLGVSWPGLARLQRRLESEAAALVARRAAA